MNERFGGPGGPGGPGGWYGFGPGGPGGPGFGPGGPGGPGGPFFFKGRRGGGRARRGRTRPLVRSRDNFRYCPFSRSPVAGSSRATGRTRSTMNTGEPSLRPSIKALKFFSASAIVAFFMGPILCGPSE